MYCGYRLSLYVETVPKVMEAGEHAINSKKVDVKKAKGRTGKLFVGGLKPEMSDEDIKAAFSQYGNIVDFEMPMDKSKGQRKGFGFITFEKEDTMKELLKVGSVEIGEHKVDLRKAAPKQVTQSLLSFLSFLEKFLPTISASDFFVKKILLSLIRGIRCDGSSNGGEKKNGKKSVKHKG